MLPVKSRPLAEKAQYGVISLTVGSRKGTWCLVLIIILCLLFTCNKSLLVCSP